MIKTHFFFKPFLKTLVVPGRFGRFLTGHLLLPHRHRNLGPGLHRVAGRRPGRGGPQGGGGATGGGRWRERQVV